MDEKAMDEESASSSSCLGATGRPAGTFLDSKIQEAIRLKSEGNALYREKKLRTAISRYHHALLVLRGMDSEVNAALQGFGAPVPKLSPQQEDLLRSTQIDCYNNLAACLLQRKVVDYERVLKYSLKVLRWRTGDIKALYRAGVSSLELGDAQAARQYLTQASRGKPNDADVKKQLQRVEERLSEDYQREKALYRGMFAQQTP